MNTTFTPSTEVTHAHQIPHLGSNLQLSTIEADFSFDDAYFLSLMPFPALLLSLSLIIIISYAVVVYWRKWQLNIFSKILSCSEKSGRISIKNVTIALLFALFLTNFFLFFHHASGGIAVKSAVDDFEKITDLFTTVSSSATSITQSSDNILSVAGSTTCKQTNANQYLYAMVYSQLVSLTENSMTIKNYASPIETDVISAAEQVEAALVYHKSILAGVFFSVIFLLVSSYSASIYYLWEILFRVNNYISWIILTPLLIISCVETTVVMAYADFCWTPVENIVSAIETMSGGQVYRNIANYYLSCKGVNPFIAPLDDVESYISSVGSTTIAAYQQGIITADCYNSVNAELASMTSQSTIISDNVYNCVYIYNYFVNVINSMCSDGFSGLYGSWVVQFVLCIELLLLMIVTCFGIDMIRGTLTWNEKRVLHSLNSPLVKNQTIEQ